LSEIQPEEGKTDLTLNDSEPTGTGIKITRNPKDIIYMLLFVAFGIWILSTFLLKTNIFGDLSSMCGPFLVMGGICFIFTSPTKLRKVGSLLGLLGSGVACFMFFTMQELVNTGTFIYSPIMVTLALLTSLLCLLVSIAQLCKTL